MFFPSSTNTLILLIKMIFFTNKEKTEDLLYQAMSFMEKGQLEVEALTYIRGRSISDAFVIIDEAQNLTAHEVKTIITISLKKI